MRLSISRSNSNILYLSYCGYITDEGLTQFIKVTATRLILATVSILQTTDEGTNTLLVELDYCRNIAEELKQLNVLENVAWL